MLPNIDQISNQNVANPVQPRRQESEKALEAYRASQEEKARAKAVEPAPDRQATPERDQVEISLSLTREEREAFRTALESRQNGSKMTEQEKSTLEQASEKISGFIESVVSRNTDNRERVEKAVNAWYSRITKGEHQGPVDLINLLRQAAMGTLDDIAN